MEIAGIEEIVVGRGLQGRFMITCYKDLEDLKRNRYN
jgi:hypothetical protein